MKNALEKLHNDFVFVPTDKACYCLQIILHRCLTQRTRVIKNANATKTYVESNFDEDEIFCEHVAQCSKWNIEVMVETMAKLPLVHWMPKMHKNPTKFDSLQLPKPVRPKTCQLS